MPLQVKTIKLKQKLRKSARNPFEPLDVKGPLDRRPIQHNERLHQSVLQSLTQALQAYKQGALSPPFLTLVGETGAGKSHLLNQLIRNATQAQEEQRFYYVNAKPVPLLQAGYGEVASVLLEAFQSSLFATNNPGFESCRPIDMMAFYLMRILIEEGKATRYGYLRYEPNWIQKFLGAKGRSYPAAFCQAFSGEQTTFATNLNHLGQSLGEETRARLLHSLLSKLQSNGALPGSLKPLLCDLLELSFGTKGKEYFDTSTNSAQEILSDWTELLSFLQFHLVFVLDQFEDLQALPGGTLQEQFKRFLLQLFDLMRTLEGEGNHKRVPAVLLAVTKELSPEGQDKHFRDRLPLLPHGAQFLSMHVELQERTLRFLTENCLRYFWDHTSQEHKPQHVDPLWPFTEEQIRNLIQGFPERGSVRHWLMTCRDAWHQWLHEGQASNILSSSDILSAPRTQTPSDVNTWTPTPMPAPTPQPEPTPKTSTSPVTSGTYRSSRASTVPQGMGAEVGTRAGGAVSPAPPKQPSPSPLRPEDLSPVAPPATPSPTGARPLLTGYSSSWSTDRKWEHLVDSAELRELAEKLCKHHNLLPGHVYRFLGLLVQGAAPVLQHTPLPLRIHEARKETRLARDLIAVTIFNIPTFIGLSWKQNRGRGFGGEWDIFKKDREEVLRQHYRDLDLENSKSLLLRLTPEGPPGSLYSEVSTFNFVDNKNGLTHETLQMFACLLVADLLPVSEFRTDLDTQSMMPFWRECFHSDWGFFSSVKWGV